MMIGLPCVLNDVLASTGYLSSMAHPCAEYCPAAVAVAVASSADQNHRSPTHARDMNMLPYPPGTIRAFANGRKRGYSVGYPVARPTSVSSW